jgi:hypothetical protein
MRNRPIVLNLTAAVLAFVVGVVSAGTRPHHQPPTTGALSPKSQTPECPTPGHFLDIDYCDLMANPQRYDRRIVRFDAIMLADPGYEPLNDDVRLGTPVCEHLLWVNTGFHLSSRTCPLVLAKLDSLLMRYDPVYPSKNAKVRVVGRFFSSKDIILSGGGGWWQ